MIYCHQTWWGNDGTWWEDSWIWWIYQTKDTQPRPEMFLVGLSKNGWSQQTWQYNHGLKNLLYDFGSMLIMVIKNLAYINKCPWLYHTIYCFEWEWCVIIFPINIATWGFVLSLFSWYTIGFGVCPLCSDKTMYGTVYAYQHVSHVKPICEKQGHPWSIWATQTRRMRSAGNMGKTTPTTNGWNKNLNKKLPKTL